MSEETGGLQASDGVRCYKKTPIVGDPVEKCPCFDEGDLETAIKGITDKEKEVLDESCASATSTSISLFYKDTSSVPNPLGIEGYKVYVSNFSESRSCRSGGDMVTNDISSDSASHCFSLIENVCQHLKMS